MLKISWSREKQTNNSFQKTVLEGTNLKIYPFATRSFGDEIGGTIGGDAQLLSFGFMIVFLYIGLMLGK